MNELQKHETAIEILTSIKYANQLMTSHKKDVVRFSQLQYLTMIDHYKYRIKVQTRYIKFLKKRYNQIMDSMGKVGELDFEINGVEVSGDYEYQASEPEQRYDSNMSGYPGCGEEFYLYNVYYKGVNVAPLLEALEYDYNEPAYDSFNNQNEY